MWQYLHTICTSSSNPLHCSFLLALALPRVVARTIACPGMGGLEHAEHGGRVLLVEVGRDAAAQGARHAIEPAADLGHVLVVQDLEVVGARAERAVVLLDGGVQLAALAHRLRAAVVALAPA